MSDVDRYQLTPAWHVIDMGGREMAAATSAADGEAIVAALNSHRGVMTAFAGIETLLRNALAINEASARVNVKAALRIAHDRTGGQHAGAVEALRMLADLHHRTKVPSKLHDPDNQDWTECVCASCQLAHAIVEGEPGPEEATPNEP